VLVVLGFGGIVAARDLLITTYPGHKSQNVGDNLISHSAMELVRSRCLSYNPEIIFREDSLDAYVHSPARTILAPGFSVSNGTYPKLFRLFSDLNDLDKFSPIGCSFQHPVPCHDSFDSYCFDESTLNFLRRVADLCGDDGIPCRDMLIENLLQSHGVNSYYCGDLGLFEEKFVGSDFIPPSNIRSIVFTIQHHHSRFDEQARILLALLEKRFQGCRKFIAFHSKPGKLSEALAQYAGSLGFETLHMHGDVSNLSLYESIDLHVGYRLHGHITFLRKRKPSVLLIEDCRSFGFSNSGDFGVGCFDALNCQTMLGFSETPFRVMDYLERQISAGFVDYGSTFDLIDKTYLTAVSPFFDRFCSLLK